MADEEPKDAKAEEEKAKPTEVEPKDADAKVTEPEAEDKAEPEAEAKADQKAEASDAEPAAEPEGEAEEAEEDDEYDELTPEELEEARASEVAFSWEASEFVHHHKGPGWYAALFGGLAVLVVGAALLKYWLSIGLFVAMGGAIMVYARKPPRTLLYELTPKGITIDGKAMPFTELRSFGVLKEEEWHTIDLEPTKRFSPRLAILFDSDDFESIVGHLELHLPRADRDPDVIERLSRLLRF